MSNVRGATAQELPENQDPGVQFSVDEVTGAVTPWACCEPAEPVAAEPPKKRARKQEVTPDAPAEGEGE